MAFIDDLNKIAKPLGDSIRIESGPAVTLLDRASLAKNIERVVRTAAFGTAYEKGLASWFIRACALEAGAVPASIHDFYLARGRGEVRDDFTVPAMNLRAISFSGARAVFRAAIACDASALIFEIARSEMGYTDQRPAEYASSVLGAAIAEGYQGPIFIQGDHFQVSAGRYAEDPDKEVSAVSTLSDESIKAGFFNIDIDTSTLVDLEQPTIPEQQKVNFTLCAEIAARIRDLEPEGVTISLGGEIGEVGGQNSTEPELRAFMEGFDREFERLLPAAEGLSKISIQTGTSHGGVVLPDGSIAEVAVDFDTLHDLSIVAKEFGMGGAVQHGASTLPEEAFTKFSEAGALEVHLATGFQNIMFDEMPVGLRDELYAYLDQNHSDERKAGQTDDQFYYKTRKRAIGPFKAALWNMPPGDLKQIEDAWEKQFMLLFERLNIRNTRAAIEKHTRVPHILPEIRSYLLDVDIDEDVSDLAD